MQDLKRATEHEAFPLKQAQERSLFSALMGHSSSLFGRMQLGSGSNSQFRTRLHQRCAGDAYWTDERRVRGFYCHVYYLTLCLASDDLSHS